MQAHFRRSGGEKSLRSAKEFPNIFQTAVLLKNKELLATGMA
jgi:hypothetical protein